MKKIILVIALFVLIFNFVPKCIAEIESTTPTLSVTGQGEVKAKPDVASLNIGITSKGKTANEATRANATLAQKLVDTLIANGIVEKDIQTSNVSVYPIYKSGDPDFYNDSSKIIGYQANNQVNATIRDIDDVGHIIDVVALAGNYTISGVNFSLDKKDPFEADALKKAVSDARRKADVVAAAAGKSINGIKKIVIGSGVDIFNKFAPLGGISDEASTTPILPGELSVSSDVSIDYTLDD